MVRLKLHRREPLLAELEAFAAAAGGGDAEIVTGQDGLVALDLALKLVQAACENRVIHWTQPERTGEPEDPS
jgi:hypothetical protein